MKGLTLRNLPVELAAAMERTACERGSSLTRAAVLLLEKGVGLTKTARGRQHHLDGLHGAWSEQQASALDAAFEEQRRIDPELWP